MYISVFSLSLLLLNRIFFSPHLFTFCTPTLLSVSLSLVSLSLSHTTQYLLNPLSKYVCYLSTLDLIYLYLTEPLSHAIQFILWMNDKNQIFIPRGKIKRHTFGSHMAFNIHFGKGDGGRFR